MYGHDLGQTDQYFGPPAPGQTWGQYESQMSALIPVGAVLMAVHPVLGLAAMATGIFFSGGQHPNKPKIQGG